MNFEEIAKICNKQTTENIEVVFVDGYRLTGYKIVQSDLDKNAVFNL